MGCGEYGDNSFRCHYHLIIFGIGIDFNTIKYYGKDKTYQSENGLIEKCWEYGNVFNGAVTYNSARYVASYIFKQYNGKLAEDVYTSNGYEIPFQKISNGIGKNWYNDYKYNAFSKNYIMFNGVKHSIPRYFWKLADKENLFEQMGTDRQWKLKMIAKERYEEAYKNIQSDLAKKLLMQPDEFNSNIIGDYTELYEQVYYEYVKNQKEQQLNKAKHLEYKDRIYNGG